MKEQLIELLNTIFQRDNEAITDIIDKFDYKEEDYTRPPENVEQFIDDMMHQNNAPEVNCEFSHGHIHTEETKSNGLKLPEARGAGPSIGAKDETGALVGGLK